jgi:hypothetical protein
MKPDWEKLHDEFADTYALVADVDCTADGKPLCDDNDVKSFPTLMYGDPKGTLEKYEGGREYDDLKAHAQTLAEKPTCGPANLDVCDDDTKAAIRKIAAIPLSQLETEVGDLSGKKEAADAEFEKLVTDLEDQFRKEYRARDEVVESYANSKGLKIMKAVLASK